MCVCWDGCNDQGQTEDPATGSAHCALGPFWSARLDGKKMMFARQSSPRVGRLCVELLSDSTVRVSGRAAVFSKGTVYVHEDTA